MNDAFTVSKLFEIGKGEWHESLGCSYQLRIDRYRKYFCINDTRKIACLAFYTAYHNQN